MDAGEAILQFPAGARWFAVPVAGISAIREAGPVTPVPGAPPAIAGIIEMRGRIVTLMDLAEIFGLGPAPSACRIAVQLADPHAHLALLVPAAIQDLRTAPGTAPRTTPDGAQAPAPGTGPAALGREVLLAGGAPAFLLDLQALTDHCTARVRDRFRVTA